MNIIFLALPAAGKGTQSEKVCKNYHLQHISTGDLLREAASKNDSLSMEIKDKMQKGLLIDDSIITNLVSREIKGREGFVFDGFPRNLSQAKLFDEMLKENNQKIDYVIYLTIDEEVAKQRILSRFVCPVCQSVYNIKDESDKICSKCNSQLVKREDDNIEVFNKRLEVYKTDTAPIIDYYKEQGILFEVDSSLAPDLVFDQIKKIIGEL